MKKNKKEQNNIINLNDFNHLRKETKNYAKECEILRFSIYLDPTKIKRVSSMDELLNDSDDVLFIG